MKPVQAGRRNTQGERNMTNKPIYIKIYDKIKSAIKGGPYPPGSFLPTEQELETLYQVSRTTIRKAVKLLSDEGILSVRQGCGTMGYGSLGGGILTGQFREVPTFGHGDMRASFYGPMFTEPGFSQIQALLKVMDGIAEAHKATVAQVAINWSLAHDYIHTVLTGVGNAAEAEENCAAAAWELTAQEKQALDEAISKIHIYS